MKRTLLAAALIISAIMALGVWEVAAAPLEIVEVDKRMIDCLFHETCMVNSDIHTDDLVLSDGVTGLLHSRTFIGQPGLETAGHYGFEYQIDMRNALGIFSQPCVKTLTIDFGHVVNAFDYDRSGSAGEHVYVVTTGNTGAIGIESANKVGPTIEFTFEEPLCSGDASGPGDLSYAFGLVSGAPSHLKNASVRETPVALDRVVEAVSPMLAEQVNRVSMESFDTDGDRRLSDSEFFNAIDLWLTQGNVPGTEETLDDIVFFNLIDWWIGGAPLFFDTPDPIPVRGKGFASLRFANEQLTLELPSRTTATLKLFNSAGQLMLTEQNVGSQLRVRALDNMGRVLANGAYFYQVTTSGGFSELHKIAIVR